MNTISQGKTVSQICKYFFMKILEVLLKEMKKKKSINTSLAATYSNSIADRNQRLIFSLTIKWDWSYLKIAGLREGSNLEPPLSNHGHAPLLRCQDQGVLARVQWEWKGSVFQWHPDLKIGFAYVPSGLEWSDLTNTREGLLQEEVVRWVNRISSSVDTE